MNLNLLAKVYCNNEYLDARPHYVVIDVDEPFVGRMLANMRWVRDCKKRKDGNIYAVELWDYSPEWVAGLGGWEETSSALNLLSGAPVSDFLSGTTDLTPAVSDGGIALVAEKPPIDEDDPSSRTECGTRVVTTDGVKWRAIVKHTSDYVDTATIELATWRKVRAILRTQRKRP